MRLARRRFQMAPIDHFPAPERLEANVIHVLVTGFGVSCADLACHMCLLTRVNSDLLIVDKRSLSGSTNRTQHG